MLRLSNLLHEEPDLIIYIKAFASNFYSVLSWWAVATVLVLPHGLTVALVLLDVGFRNTLQTFFLICVEISVIISKS